VGAFGDKFRKERERRGFTLDQVSNVTKINARMLKAIEDEHFDLLPGGVFNKGFVRAYAKHLGFNDEESVTEYLAALRQAQVEAETAAWQGESPVARRDDAGQSAKTNGEKVRVESKPAAPAVKVSQRQSAPEKTRPAPKRELPTPQTQESTPARVPAAQKYSAADLSLGSKLPGSDSIPWKVPAVVLGVILVAAILWNRHSRGVRAEVANGPHQPDATVAVNNSAAVAASTSTAATGATPATPSSSAPSNLPPPNLPPSRPQSAGNGEVSQNASAAMGHEPNAASNNLASERAAADGTTSNHERPSRNRPSVAPAKNPPAFTLRIRASETSWIAVTVDGQPVIHETLIAPAGTFFRASREITVRVGNAAGVSFQINGKEIPPQGGEAEVKTLTFDSQGLR
jgi:cytoskeletal protein RodZ